MKTLTTIVLFLLCSFNINAQLGAELIQLNEAPGLQQVRAFEKTSDGNIIAIIRHNDEYGTSASRSYLITKKYDKEFNILWEYSDSTQYDDVFYSLVENNVGYLYLSKSATYNYDSQLYDGCTTKLTQLDFDGNLLWQNCYELDYIWHSDLIMLNNKIIIMSNSEHGGNTNFSYPKFYVFDTDGNFESEHLYEEADIGNEFNFNYFTSFEKINENEFYVTAITNDIYIPGNDRDFLVLKYSFDGEFELVQSETFGGAGRDRCYNAKLLSNGNLVLTGYISYSYGGDISTVGYQSYNNSLIAVDMWVVCLNSDLEIVWDKTLGGTRNDYFTRMYIDEYDNIYLSGTTESKDFDCSNWIHYSGNNTFRIPVVFKLNSKGDLLWDYIHGEGDGGSSVYSRVLKFEDELFIATNHSFSGEPNFACPFVTPNYDGPDYYFSKINAGLNTIHITCFYDVNQNQIQDVGEPFIDCETIAIQPNEVSSLQYGPNSTIYNVTDGTYSISYENEEWNPSTDLPSEIIFPREDSILTLSLGIYPLFSTKSFEVDFAESVMLCNETFSYWVNINNTGTEYLNGSINIEFDPLLTYNQYSVEAPVNINITESEGNVDANFTNLPPLTQTSIQFVFNSPNEQQLGELIPIETLVEVGDVTEGNSSYQAYSEVETLCSYDPNDKLVEPSHTNKNYALIDGGLLYTIRFQNTGNYPAQKVVIRDTIDQLLELNDLRVISSSHEMVTKITPSTRVVEFTFDDIWLIDSLTNEPLSHGFVKFFINPVEGIADYTEVWNRAGIFFDNNPPIITNNLLSTLVYEYSKPAMGFFENNADNFDELFTNVDDLSKRGINIYPNPFNDFLVVESSFELLVNIYNTNGMLVQSSKSNQINIINTSNFVKGIYLVEIIGNGGEASYRKILKTNF